MECRVTEAAVFDLYGFGAGFFLVLLRRVLGKFCLKSHVVYGELWHCCLSHGTTVGVEVDDEDDDADVGGVAFAFRCEHFRNA